MSENHETNSGHHEHHVISWQTYLGTFVALVALTIITVLTAKHLDIGMFNVPLALAIAGTKATLVLLFFMGQRWENGFNRMVIISTLLFFLIFVAFTLADTLFRGVADDFDGRIHTIQKNIVDPNPPAKKDHH